MKEAVPIPSKPSINFVIKGGEVSPKKTPLFVFLHHASDWVLLVDLNSNYCLPVHIYCLPSLN